MGLATDDTCLKFKSQLHLKKIFERIFSSTTIEHSDPNITQQIRQRDCGPNSLTVLLNTFKYSVSDTPLLLVNDQDKLVIIPDRLTVNFNNMRLMNYETSNSENKVIYNSKLLLLPLMLNKSFKFMNL